MENHYQLGFVLRAHGITGGLRIRVETDFPERYKSLKQLYLHTPKQTLSCQIVKLQFSTAIEALLQVKEINTRDEAELWKGASIWVSMDFLPPLIGKKQFYFHEVIGFEVKDEHLGIIGKITQFYENLAHPIIAVDHQGKEVLIPAVDEFICEVNRVERYIAVTLPENWLEIYLD